MITLRTMRVGAVLGLLLIVTASCNSDDSGSSSSTSSSPPSGSPLTGTEWTLADSPDIPAVGVTVTAQFADGQVTGNGGCNTYHAPFKEDGTKLRIGPEISSTRMACAKLPMTVETTYFRVLPEIRSYEFTGEQLKLLDGSGTARLVYKSSGGVTAIVGSWTVTTFYTGDALVSPAAGSELTAEFDTLEVSGDGGCNTFGGEYKVTGNKIEIGPFRSTLKACTDPALGKQEQQYLAALELASTFRVTENTLGLVRADGGVAVTFERAAAPG